MSTTLSNGYKKPSTGDTGSVFFKDLENNIQKVNDHTHNGQDSEKILSKDIVKSLETIQSTSWGAMSDNGDYTQTITMPLNYEFDKVQMEFRIASGPEIGSVIFPTITKVSANSYTITQDDNTIDIQVVYV